MKNKFKAMTEMYPNHTTLYCFELCIKGQKMTRIEILKWFNKLVDKEDWMGCGKVELVNYLVKYSAGALDYIKGKGEAKRL